ncbi:hypothetical protein M5Q85_001607 [Citrobacter freundii]
MSTITKERIANLIEFNSEGSDCQANAEQWEVHELARIALTSLEAEPVADVVAWSSQNEERTCDVRLRRHDIKPGILYTAPPAPVVPDEMYWQDAPVEGSTRAAAYATGWNACRAAMLQAGNSPVTPDGWQLVPKEPTEAMNKAGWAAMNEHDAINPTYRAMLAAAPQQDVRLALEIGMSRYAGAMQKLVDSGD